jgi:hypothetical protein
LRQAGELAMWKTCSYRFYMGQMIINKFSG